jgi:hypothetical protein
MRVALPIAFLVAVGQYQQKFWKDPKYHFYQKQK